MDKFINGQIACYIYNAPSIDLAGAQMKQKHPEWTTEIYDGSFGKKVLKTPYINSGFAIHATSKNPERCLMLCDLARTDEELNTLFCYGLKDINWIDTGPKTYRQGPVLTDSLTWPFRNEKYQRMNIDTSPDVLKLYESFSTRICNNPLNLFSFNDMEYKNEMAAMDSVIKQYGVPVLLGYANPDEGIPQLVEQLKKAGLEKVLEGIQSQVESYLADANSPVW